MVNETEKSSALEWARLVIGTGMFAGMLYIQFFKNAQLSPYLYGFPGLLLGYERLDMLTKLLGTWKGTLSK